MMGCHYYHLQAGLCSPKTCGVLQKASESLLEVPNEKEPDKLSLALEPESAAIYCQSMNEQLVAAYCTAQKPYDSKCNLVVDVGGGTIDISAYRVSSSTDRHIQIVHPPTGNDCGGSCVNKAFQDFLGELVNDKKFSRYLRTNDPETDANHAAALNDLINRTFEDQKLIFGNKGGVGSKLTIRLPFTFLKVYQNDLENGIRQMGDSRVKQVGIEIRIEYSKMADFFQPVVEGVFDCMSQTLADVDAEIDTIYLVGGFGGCCYVYNYITKRLGNKYNYITPAEPDFAVIYGAVLFRKNLNIIRARKADATYGIEVSNKFDSRIHEPEYKYVDDDGVERCNHIFSTIVEKGDLVCTEELNEILGSYHTNNHHISVQLMRGFLESYMLQIIGHLILLKSI